MREREPQPKKYEDTFNNSLKQKHLEHKSHVDNEVFDLVDLRKIKARNYVTGRWLLIIKTDKQRNFLKAKERWVLKGFQDKQKTYQQTDSPATTRPGFRMSCQTAASRSWNIFHIDLKTTFLQRQSYGLNRDVVCQLPPEAGHPPYIAARLKKRAYGINDALDAGGTFWTRHCVITCGMVPTRADRGCCVLYSTQTRERTWNQKFSTQWHNTKQHLNLNRVRD